MIQLDRARPNRAALKGLLGFLWAITFGAVRDFVWADIRYGLIRLGGLSRGIRLIVWLGFGLVFVMVGVLLFNESWRQQFPLVSMPAALGMEGRGRTLPVALVPLTNLLLAVAWTFALAGTLHSRPLLRIGLVTLYALQGVQKVAVLVPLLLYGITTPANVLVHAGLVALVPVFFALRWRKKPAEAHPAVEFVILLAVVSAPLALAQIEDYDSWRVSGIPMLFNNLEDQLLSFRLLASPLLLLIGIDVANFARRVAGWTTEVVAGRMTGAGPAVVLLALLVWRIITLGLQMRSSIAGSVNAYTGALVELLLMLLLAWVVLRSAQPDERDGIGEDRLAQSVERIALPLILLYLAMQLASFVLLTLASAFPLPGFAQGLIDVSATFNERVTDPWRLLVDLAALAAALGIAWRLRHGQPSRQSRLLALYLGIFSIAGLWNMITVPGGFLQAYAWYDMQEPGLWWMAAIAALTLYWLVKRELTPARVSRLLFALLITILLQETGFLENRFSPIFGATGIGFVAFGIVWDVLTGAAWVNTDSPGLPRVGRVFLYIGYMLLTITVINWALAAHDQGSIATLTGGAVNTGFGGFGRPLLYAALAATIMPELVYGRMLNEM